MVAELIPHGGYDYEDLSSRMQFVTVKGRFQKLRGLTMDTTYSDPWFENPFRAWSPEVSEKAFEH